MARPAPTSISREPDLPHQPSGRLDAYFRLSERGSTLTREVRGGLATFFTMAYIVVLNPLIVGTAKDSTGAILGVERVTTMTALVAGVMTIAMGVIGRFPLAVATGLGLNAFVAITLASQMTWAGAMGLVVLEGIVITILVFTGFRTAVFHAIPAELKTAIGVGIGLFIALIGFVDGGFVRRTSTGPVPVELGVGGNLAGWPTFVFVVGVILTAVLVARRVQGAILIGIVVSTLLAIVVEAIAKIGPSFVSADEFNPQGWGNVVPELPSQITDFSPDFSLFGSFSLTSGFADVGVVAALLFVFSLMLADFFDTMGTVFGIGTEAGLIEEDGTVPDLERVLAVDSIAAIAGGVASTSSNTTFVESAAGVGEGARTGIASIITGALFLLAIFFTPLVRVVPYEAATPALVVVGFLMFTQIRSIDFGDYQIAIPAFLTIVVMPFSYSITNGIGAGFVSYVVIKAASGQSRELHPLLWLIAVLFGVYFAINPLQQLLGVI